MAESIITSEKPSTSSPLEPPSRIVCHVCQKQFSQYTCPRCNSRYCSLHCYKVCISRIIRCTESFMKENVVGELGQLGPDDETKQKMLDILKRFHSEEEETDDMDDDDNAGSALSEETIQKVLSGGEVSLDDLSTEEKKLFQRAVVSGELSKMIKPWDPWWLKPSARTISFSKEGSQLIQPLVKDDESMSPEDNSESNQASEIPPGPDTPLPPVSKLSSTKPSPSLAVHLVDIIYSYCFTLRLYNGDWKSDAIGSSVAVLSVSNVLGQGGQPETVLEVLSYCLEKTCSPDFKHTGGLQFGLGLIDDVTSLLMLGTPALLCLLCDLQRMVQAGERDLKSEKPRKLSRRTEIRNKLKLAERKIYFIMCWVHEQTGEVWTPLAAIVTAEKSSALSYQSASRPGKAEKKAEPKSKVLIQEIR
nr:zinc finger HIT domain-containing protein 2 isoform X3 [Malus domestica]